jgi:hypothetical protein
MILYADLDNKIEEDGIYGLCSMHGRGEKFFEKSDQ